MTRHLALLAGLAGFASSALAANPGDVLWSIQRDGYGTAHPSIAPDGSLYWPFRGLYRLNPANGEVVWFREDHASPIISIGPDGTIYGTGSVNMGTPEDPFWHPTALALTPDNQVIWQWLYNQDYWYPEAGPTLGPDGNLYIISYAGYRTPGHLFSLTTSGQWRWEFRNFATGSGLQHLTFAGGAVMKVGDYTNQSGGPLVNWGAGLVAARMDTGQFAWSIPFPAGGDPVVSRITGNYYVTPRLWSTIHSLTPPTSENWSWTTPWSPTGLNTRQIGPDGNLYISEGIFNVHSLNEQGQIRWTKNNILPGSYYYIPSVSPDGRVIIYSMTGPGETPGYVTALRTSDGQKLWEITLPGPVNGYNHVRSSGGVAFSADSSVAYIPAISICYSCPPNGYAERSHLFAVSVSGGGTPACYANCDSSTAAPVLNVGDFTCFLQRFAAGESYANCDQSTAAPVLNVGDFTCFLQRFAQGCP
jgi:hypothetical protein